MVLAVVDDLLFSSKIRAAASASGAQVVFARGQVAAVAALVEHQPGLVLIDLDARSVDAIAIVRALREENDSRLRIVGFGAHVNVERLQAARDAGCDEALARSAFVATLPELLASAASIH